ncbi:MAG: hypothetical protein ACXVBE_13690 [Bdellovibrionota bacterium]
MKKMKLIQGSKMEVRSALPKNAQRQKIQGPSYFEVEYLHQMKEELEIFLRSKNFSTIHKFDIAFSGDDYQGLMKVHA